MKQKSENYNKHCQRAKCIFRRIVYITLAIVFRYIWALDGNIWLINFLFVFGSSSLFKYVYKRFTYSSRARAKRINPFRL